MQKRINSLLKIVGESDRVELVLLNNAFVAATNSQKQAPSAKSMKEWQSMKKQLEALVEDLEEKHDLSSERQGVFPTKIAVHRWLVDNGWQISRSQFYGHCKDGLLRPNKRAGGYRLADVEKYAAIHVRREATGEKETEREIRMREEKLAVSLEREQVGLERERFELDRKKGRYIPREDHELAVVGRAVAFMAHLNHAVQKEVGDWIELVEGNPLLAPLLVDAISGTIEQRMGDFAADAEFEIFLEASE